MLLTKDLLRSLTGIDCHLILDCSRQSQSCLCSRCFPYKTYGATNHLICRCCFGLARDMHIKKHLTPNFKLKVILEIL